MSLQEMLGKGVTYVYDPTGTKLTPDDFLAQYGNIVDSIAIVAKAEKIRLIRVNQPISLRTTAPICSKTARYLADHGIKIV